MLELALELAEKAGFHVFPVREGTKAPDPRLAPRGFHDATNDSVIIRQWWTEQPNSLVGVAAGASGLAILDVDVKDNVDGFDSLDKHWLEIPNTHTYPSLNGRGKHFVYLAPEGVPLAPAADYRHMRGVDRRAGGSYVVWTGGIPEHIAPAPDWLLDPSRVRSLDSFEGDLKAWYDALTPGEPNTLVRRAIDRVSDDMSHSDMVGAQHEAVRLGAEGNPGVPHLLARLEEAFLARDPGSHKTPESEWAYKFTEALVSGVSKYGGLTDLLTAMPEYSMSLVPGSIPEGDIMGTPKTSPEFTRVLHSLTRLLSDDATVASILWNAPALKYWAREWGVEFLYHRIREARELPQPETENPALVETQKTEKKRSGLLSNEEREYLRLTPTFADYYLASAQSQGFANPHYNRAGAWTCASMAYAFKGFIPVSSTDKMGLNLWNMTLGESGTGKAQPLSAHVLTPTGFIRMGDVTPGTEIVVPNGGTAPVSDVYPQGERPVYTVTFADGRIVEADEDHPWTVQEGNTTTASQKTVTTRGMLDKGLYIGSAQQKRRWFVPVIDAPDLGQWSSGIDPYSLGLLIGDGYLGKTESIAFTCFTDPELVGHLRNSVPDGMGVVEYAPGSFQVNDLHTRGNRWVTELRALDLLGTTSRDKKLPDSVKYVSAADRLALLQGIMDTDGTPAKSGNSVDFVSASEQLRDDVVWLVRSLGGTASVATKMVTLDGWTEARQYYRTYATLPGHLSFFRLERKKSRHNNGGKYGVRALPIVSIEYKGVEQTQCILVDHPTHEYVTNDFVRTHNTRAIKFRDAVLELLFPRDEMDETPGYNLGTDSSLPGLHEALLHRDRKGSFFGTDEATGFFKAISKNDSYQSGIDDTLNKWYEGRIDPSNKVRLKELKGKSALTSLGIQMYATPDRLLETLNADQFKTGFLARFNWVIGDPPIDSDERFNLQQQENPDEFEEVSPVIRWITNSLVVTALDIPTSKPLLAEKNALKRMSEAVADMHRQAVGTRNWDIIEPSVTRLMEALRKVSGVNCMVRGGDKIDMTDTLQAIATVEEWYNNLFTVAAEISSGQFMREAAEIEQFIRQKGGSATRPVVLHQFGNLIKNDSREIEARLIYLTESGRLLREEKSGRVQYIINE